MLSAHTYVKAALTLRVPSNFLEDFGIRHAIVLVEEVTKWQNPRAYR